MIFHGRDYNSTSGECQKALARVSGCIFGKMVFQAAAGIQRQCHQIAEEESIKT
jgi:hypothetical protein